MEGGRKLFNISFPIKKAPFSAAIFAQFIKNFMLASSIMTRKMTFYYCWGVIYAKWMVKCCNNRLNIVIYGFGEVIFVMALNMYALFGLV